MYEVEDITDNVNEAEAKLFSVIHNMEFYTVSVKGGKIQVVENIEDPEIMEGVSKAVEEYIDE